MITRFERVVLIGALMATRAPARAEPPGRRVEVVLGEGLSFGLLDEVSPLSARGVGLRALLPARRPTRDLELALDWRRLSGGDIGDSDFTSVDSEQYDRLRLTIGRRFRHAPSRRRVQGHARLGIGLEIAHGKITMRHRGQDAEPTTYETRRGFPAGAVGTAGVGFAVPIGRFSICLELEAAAGALIGKELSYVHEPGGLFAEAQVLVVLGADISR